MIDRFQLWAIAANGDGPESPLIESRRSVMCVAMKLRTLWTAIALLVAGSGCHQYLVATPNILQDQDPEQFYAACPQECRTAQADVIYATDRLPRRGAGYKKPDYGSRAVAPAWHSAWQPPSI